MLSRHAVGEAIHSPPGWPLATLIINVSGALVLGLLLEGLQRRGPDAGRRRTMRLLFGTGLLGGFTTYSALALEAVLLLELADHAGAAWYLALTLLCGAVASYAGIWCGAALHRSGPGRGDATDQALPGQRPGREEEKT